MSCLIQLRAVHRSFPHKGTLVTALQHIDLSIAQGESCAITGTSGSGKSTLLNILGLLDKPDAGIYQFRGVDVTTASADQLARIRNDNIGFVFQAFNLLPQLDAIENVALPLYYRGICREQARQAAFAQLQRIGLGARASHRPADLSGGQRQRVAIARALVGEPSVLLADEPTGSLDDPNAEMILDILFQLNREKSVSVILVTHDMAAAARCQHHVEIRNGRLSESPAANQRIA